MDEASSSTPKSDAKQLKTTTAGGLFSLLNDDLLHDILARLPAPSFASAACVSKSWSRTCTLILSRPKLASALSLNPSLQVAWEEVTQKVLAEPIRPHFIIANVGSGFRLVDVNKLVKERFGSRAPFVVSTANGILGRDVVTCEIKEVQWDSVSSDVSDDDASVPAEDGSYGIVLTVGFVPGLKVDAIPLLSTSVKECQEVFIDKFVMDIKDYTASVSDCTAPVGIIMFGDGYTNMRPVVDALDYVMPEETVIVGDEKGRFLYRSENESRNVCGTATSFSVAVALIFARDRQNSCGIGDIQFQIALSEGVSTVGPKHKAVSVRASASDSTWLTARREGHREILDGQRILNDINDELENHTDSSDLYIGVKKRRSISTGPKTRRLVTSLDFHGVIGGDESYLYVNDVGIKTGDYFHFYRPDPQTALSSCTNLSVSLKNLKIDENSKDCCNLGEVFGGFIFACCGRGESFFERVNVDSSPFVENFPRAPLGGIFCGGEIGRGSSMFTRGAQKDCKCNLHVYSTIYLVLSCTPAALDH
ncbi:F-box/LRR-repeat protein At5g63520-like isoform X1 [Rosa rugosa]|uniref:F-box/LRR-repeat protein At5g63520-like isoform X1 n=1 Tax=Rosa rugosa TaxID=74645 RepID=UPI002B411C0F|nr:F-box/LRR-repeat protein At5g63520-like isoform X1 [Rosa rugosa]